MGDEKQRLREALFRRTIRWKPCFLAIASEPMPLYVILIGMTSLFVMGFFLILLQLVRMKFVILLLPVF